MSIARGGYHHGELASTLEEAASKLLEQIPAHEISLREVARAAGVSHNAPYHHFNNRLGLLKALTESSMKKLIDEIQKAIADISSPSERLRAGGAAYISFAVHHPHAFNSIYDPAVCVPGSPSETMAPLINSLEGALAAANAAAGLDKIEDVYAVWGLIHGLGLLCAAGHFSLADALRSYDAALARLLP